MICEIFKGTSEVFTSLKFTFCAGLFQVKGGGRDKLLRFIVNFFNFLGSEIL
jgi:hypothetical protein